MLKAKSHNFTASQFAHCWALNENLAWSGYAALSTALMTLKANLVVLYLVTKWLLL